MTFLDVLRELGLPALAIGATDLNAFVQEHEKEITAAVDAYEAKGEKILVTDVCDSLPTGGVWEFSRGAVAKTVEGTGEKILGQLTGETPLILHLAEHYLTQLATA